MANNSGAGSGWQSGPRIFSNGNLDCPACYGPPSFLGGLASAAWFRCRDCGMDFVLRSNDWEQDYNLDTLD